MWWKDDTNQFEKFKSELEAFEGLELRFVDSKAVISGLWPVFGKDSLITRYKIEIVFPDNYPDATPLVFEVGERIKREADFHINKSDGSACLFAQPERFEKWPVGSGLRDFLNGPVKEFFFSQAYRELTGKWPFDEWSHGEEGILEYYASRFRVGRIETIKSFLEMCKFNQIYRQWNCPCGSNNRITKCHGNDIKFIRSVVPHHELDLAITICVGFLKTGKSEVKLRSVKSLDPNVG